MNYCDLLMTRMILIGALLAWLAVDATNSVGLECPNAISCPCGKEGTDVTVCVPDASLHEEVCASLLKCETCEEGLCSKCLEGLKGSFCSQDVTQSRQKRQTTYRWRRKQAPIVTSCSSMDGPKFGSIRCVSSNEIQNCTGKCLPGYRFISSGEEEMVLTCRGGQWSPRSSFPACKSGGHCDIEVVGSGSFNCTTGMDGTRCDVRCSGMYPGRYHCYPGRNWEPPLPRCVKPKTPTDSTESRVACVCKNGQSCDSNGRCTPNRCPSGWTRAECEAAQAGPPKKSCPDPGFISNGYRRNTDGSNASRRRNFEEGQLVVYGCTSEEYELKGSFLLTCKQDGTWSASKPTCIKPPTVAPRLVCPDPGQVDNANRLNTDGTPSWGVRPAGSPEYSVGHSLVYTCVPGYALERRSLITCLASGKWSYRTPYCRRITPTTTTTTTTTTKKPVIDVKWCRDPEVDPNGIREPSRPLSNRGFPAGSQLNYSCKEGYELVGSKRIFCLFEGSWSTEKPRCEPVPDTPAELAYCEYPGGISDGQVYYIPTLDNRKRPSDDREDGYPEGSQLEYTCNDGFRMEGPAILTCQRDETWTTGPPKCMIEEVVDVYCPNPGPLSNGQVEYRSAMDDRSRPIDLDDLDIPVGGRLLYKCNNGFTLAGRVTLVCLESGSWSANKPVCRRRYPGRVVYCSYPGDLGNGQVMHTPPFTEINRPVERGEQYPARSRLSYSCYDGFTLDGPVVLECLSTGSWSASPPTCTNDTYSCENPGPIANGKVLYNHPSMKKRTGHVRSPDNDPEEYPAGSVLQYKCDEGYKPFGPSNLICQSTGFWSADPPACIIDCGLTSYIPETTGKVFQGDNTTSGDWPWVVSISVDDEDKMFICGGAVINSHTVITAAHCLEGNVPLLLRFGKYHFKVDDDDEQVLVRRSSRIIPHPKYSNTTLDSDIGLIIFEPRIIYSHLVQPICLPNTESTLRNINPGEIGFIGGWGDTEKAIPPDKLMLARLPVVSNDACMLAYQNLIITENMFCAGYEDARQTVCGGDSGSPFVFYDRKAGRFILEGLVSFGVRGQCGVAGKYAIFTRVFQFIVWIRQNMK